MIEAASEQKILLESVNPKQPVQFWPLLLLFGIQFQICLFQKASSVYPGTTYHSMRPITVANWYKAPSINYLLLYLTTLGDMQKTKKSKKSALAFSLYTFTQAHYTLVRGGS